MIKKVAEIFFDEGDEYKRYSMNVFADCKIIIKGIHERDNLKEKNEIIFEGTIETLLNKLWINRWQRND